MKKLSVLKFAIALITGLTLCNAVTAQNVYQTGVVNIKLSGTSNVHDWVMTAVKGSSHASFVVNADNKITSLSRISFTLPARNLKSEHTAMDNNTYKALNTDKNPNISFVSTSANITSTEANSYEIHSTGNLTIAGTTHETELIATGRYNAADKSLTVTGVKKMKMTDYNVTPPKALFGTIKTGDAISISYNLKFTK
jgi:polyisoprenoid-binding protein YceI